MNELLQCNIPKWHKQGIRKISKGHGLKLTDFTRLALHNLILNYKGKYDHETIDKMEFEVRKKIDG